MAARKILVFGNSGSGKSTLAKALSERGALAHLDLDSLAWKPTSPPERQALDVSQGAMEAFMASCDGWVIEGCYSDLLALALPEATEMVFLNLPVEACQANARQRPWEPHKYPSKEAQDANLAMLIDWIGHYESRDDTFSLAAHRALYDEFGGTKTMLTANEPSPDREQLLNV